MSNIQKTLDSLQPYVIGIRYLEGTPLVDAVFKEGWTIPEEPTVKKVKGNDELNYYMLYSEVKGVGLDELLQYVKKTIDINIEREKKHDLLREKVNELKEFFKKNSLEKLKRLKFSFVEEDLTPKLNDFDIDIDSSYEEEPIQKTKEEEVKSESPNYSENLEEYSNPYEEEDVKITKLEKERFLDENGDIIELSEEELEMIEEEERAKRNIQYLKSKKQNDKVKNISNKVELPPR
jgi:hypothetical protein